MIKIWQSWKKHKKLQKKESISPQLFEEKVFEKNPCISYVRDILEDVLVQKNMNYQQLKLIIKDRELEIGVNQEQVDEDISEVLAQLTTGLNCLKIQTERPEYFEDFVDYMYKENGLLVQLTEKKVTEGIAGNLILDFETEKIRSRCQMNEANCYIPIYKKRWEIAPNLDIRVPIGYNIVIVKGAIKEQKDTRLDKFEREFYAK